MKEKEVVLQILGMTCPSCAQGIEAGLAKPTLIITEPALTTQNIANFILSQHNNGRTDETIRARVATLKHVARACNLNNPEEVKAYIADSTWSNSTKRKFTDTYTAYLETMDLTWKRPRYIGVSKLPFIPMEEEIDQLIAGCGTRTATALQILKETGIRIGELVRLTPQDVDYERKTLSITPEKGSNPRILPASDKLLGMIKSLEPDPRANYKTLFQPKKAHIRDCFTTQRNALAQRLNSPRLKQISFHTFRHWKGTMLYHQCHDLREVQKLLGHKQITSTVIYENTACALWLQDTDNFTCKVAHNEAEEVQLIETGFTLVNNRGESAYYKKRK